MDQSGPAIIFFVDQWTSNGPPFGPVGGPPIFVEIPIFLASGPVGPPIL